MGRDRNVLRRVNCKDLLRDGGQRVREEVEMKRTHPVQKLLDAKSLLLIRFLKVGTPELILTNSKSAP